MEMAKKGRSVGTVKCYSDTGRGLIILCRVASKRVSVERQKTTTTNQPKLPSGGKNTAGNKTRLGKAGQDIRLTLNIR